jgi:putative redox protein
LFAATIRAKKGTMIQTHRKSGYEIEIQSGRHSIVADVDAKLGGQDLGPGPHELLEAALGACTSITVQMYANRKGWKLVSCDTKVKFTREDRESIALERTIHLDGDLDDEQKRRLLEIANRCPIHEVLVRGAKIESRLE